ncbi:Fur family transcriptional regulator [Kitasatospora atroaurantiaca]|uniref:Fur family ferric uptake transcriptional regulator n=1 Tax=Kitasatospora atroaurantiaca TaxID=285545 RepID=A0A561EIZ5_9ACTN|nr:Fur family ferric uptake transcriptional regulator [Kitasatospora atroaurantiaca]
MTATAEELRGAGLRVTGARVALLETVRDGDPLGSEAIASGVCGRVGHISLQAVCEALHALTVADSYAGSNLPAARLGSRGASGTTTSCAGRVLWPLTSTARSAKPLPTVSDDHGFLIDEAEVISWGLCLDRSTARSSLAS